MNSQTSPVQHLPSGAMRRPSVGASPEPIHPSGIASLPGHTKVALSPPRNGGAVPPRQPPQQQQRRSPERRQALAGQQPYWAYSGFGAPATAATQLGPEDDAPGAWEEFYSAMHNRPYCEPLESRATQPATRLSLCASQPFAHSLPRFVSRRRDAPPDPEDGVARSYRAYAAGGVHSPARAAAEHGGGRCCWCCCGGELEACACRCC